MNLPITCTLPVTEVGRRRETLLSGLTSRADHREPVQGGFRWRFTPSPDLLHTVATVIEAERHCCRFLRFTLTVEADGGPVWLEVSGPDGTQEFLARLVVDPPRP